MNDLLQPGQHLDPDQLNAFVEGVLPEHERRESLAHLADCPHCRQIVFLAQQANEPVPVKAAATWRDWFRFSPLSMVGAASAALACALIATVALHLHHSAPPPPTTETAKIESVQNLPPVPREDARSAAPSAPARPAAKAIPLPPAPQSLASSAPPADAIQGGTISADTRTNEDNARVTTKLRRAEPSQASTALAPAPPYSPSASTADPLAGASVENLPVNGRALINAHARVTTSITQTLQAKAGLQPLPSKLPIATTVSSGALILAADSAGTLFVSKNGGEPWQAVEQQWQGKVVRLALVPQAIDQLALKKQQAEMKDSTDNRVVAPSSFQLTTEAGVIWVSDDGMRWRQQ